MPSIDRAALAWFADDRATLDLVIVNRPGPAVEVFSGENAFKTRVITLLQNCVGFLSRDFTKEDVPPTNLATVGLELDGAFRPERSLAVPKILHRGVIYHQLVIQINSCLFPDLQDTKAVSLA